jgi:DNA-binding ferritin-like protein
MSEKLKVTKMLLKLQMNVKLFHWNTKSYANHIASDELYEDLNKNIDRFVEIFLAKNDRMSHNDLITLNLEVLSDEQIVPYLKSASDYITNDDFFRTFSYDYDLQDILTDIIKSLNKAVYLMTIERRN